MQTLETLRGVLIAGAVFALVVAVFLGLWLPAVVLAVAVLVHGVLTPFIRRQAPAQGTPAPPVVT